ncbi:MAG TPA: hypothetical protein VM182_09850 [Terriglobia bacterium]|nr:hypothetical protein [Terriglobia bacterium]
MSATSARWIKSLIAVVAGNALYFSLAPHMPAAARHERFQLDLGVLVDFWFCLVVYGLIELVLHVRRRRRG